MVLSTFGIDRRGAGRSGDDLRTADNPVGRMAKAKCPTLKRPGGWLSRRRLLFAELSASQGRVFSADADCAGVYYDARHPALVALEARGRITRTRRWCGRHLANLNSE